MRGCLHLSLQRCCWTSQKSWDGQTRGSRKSATLATHMVRRRAAMLSAMPRLGGGEGCSPKMKKACNMGHGVEISERADTELASNESPELMPQAGQPSNRHQEEQRRAIMTGAFPEPPNHLRGVERKRPFPSAPTRKRADTECYAGACSELYISPFPPEFPESTWGYICIQELADDALPNRNPTITAQNRAMQRAAPSFTTSQRPRHEVSSRNAKWS